MPNTQKARSLTMPHGTTHTPLRFVRKATSLAHSAGRRWLAAVGVHPCCQTSPPGILGLLVSGLSTLGLGFRVVVHGEG